MKIILYVILLLNLISCKNNDIGGLIFKEVIENNNHINYQCFTKDGKIVYEQEYLVEDTVSVVDGNYIKYYSNGNQLFHIECKNGKKDGFSYFYFENGKINEIIHYVKDSIFGSSTLYNEDGEVLCYKFNYFNKEDEYCFKIKYGKNSKIEKIDGKPVVFAGKIRTKDTRIGILGIVAKPPKIKVSFKYVMTFKKLYNLSIEDSIKKYNYRNDYNIDYFILPCLKNADIIGTVNLYDSISNKLLYTDTVNYSTGAKLRFNKIK